MHRLLRRPLCRAAFGALATAAAACARAYGGGLPEPQVASVVLNGAPVSENELVYIDMNRRGVWVKTGTLAAWRIKPHPSAEISPARSFEQQAYRLICGEGDAIVCSFDARSASLMIAAEAERLQPVRIAAAQPERAVATPTKTLGAYANYDVQATAGRAAVQAAALDAHAFSRLGDAYLRVGAYNAGGRRVLASRVMGLQWDQPDTHTTRVLGGFLSGLTALRPPVPMVGFRSGSNFALRPDIALVSRPQVEGDVARPSRADLFVDGLFRRSGDVAYGPFVLEADALLAGAGDLQVVLTDLRGEQTVRNLRYYFAPQLLPPGLSDSSLEFGMLSPDANRLSPGRTPIVSASLRHGWSEEHTLSGTAMMSSKTRLFGVMSDRRLGTRGVVRAGVSLLDRGDGLRLRGVLGHDYQSRSLSTLVRLEAAPRDRRAPGSATSPEDRARQATLPNERHSLVATLSWVANERQQLSATLNDSIEVTGERKRSVNLTTSWRPFAGSQLTFGVQRATLPRPDNLVIMSWLAPLGPAHQLMLGASTGSARSAAQWTLQSLREGGTGSDDDNRQYRVFGQFGAQNSLGASYQRDEAFGQWRIEARHVAGRSAAAASLSGAFGWFDGSGFVTRRIGDSFILVDSDGMPDVPIYFENRFAGKTDAQGRLLIPEALSYQQNRVSLDGNALPIDHTLAQDELQIVPRARAGTEAHFEIGDAGVLVHATQAGGEPLPAGARVSVSTQSRAAAVNSRSELFINRASRQARVVVSWPGHECGFDYRPEAAGEAGRPRSRFVCT